MKNLYLVLGLCILVVTSCTKELNPGSQISGSAIQNTESKTELLNETIKKTTSTNSAENRLGCTTSITSSFNGTSIPAGRYIWFSAVMKVSGVGNNPVTINFNAQTITCNNFAINVPDAVITIDPSASSAVTTYDGSKWTSTFPVNLSGNVFLSGVGYQVPSGGLPGGIKDVTWNGSVNISDNNVSVNWKWAAAVYTSFSNNLSAIGVKPCDDNNSSIYKNSDHAGTPENFKAFVKGGARGGGGSNFTGSYSGTKSFNCTIIPDVSCPDVKVTFNQTTFCGSGTLIANVVPNIGDIVGDRLSNSITDAQIDEAFNISWTWTYNGQTYTGSNFTVPIDENLTCEPITNTLQVVVTCKSTNQVVLNNSYDIIFNPKVNAVVNIDNVFCTAEIAFSCPSVNNVSWTLGPNSGTSTIITLSSNPQPLIVNYDAFGCNYSITEENVYCLPLLQKNTSNDR